MLEMTQDHSPQAKPEESIHVLRDDQLARVTGADESDGSESDPERTKNTIGNIR